MLMTDIPTYEKKLLPILSPSMVEAEKFSDHPRKNRHLDRKVYELSDGNFYLQLSTFKHTEHTSN
jgi:hypothetical protein